MPDGPIGVPVMAATAVLAPPSHRLVPRLASGVPVPGRGRGPVRTFIAATAGPSRLAVIVAALRAVLPLAGFPDGVPRGLGQVLPVASIVPVGWGAARAIESAVMLHGPRRDGLAPGGSGGHDASAHRAMIRPPEEETA